MSNTRHSLPNIEYYVLLKGHFLTSEGQHIISCNTLFSEKNIHKANSYKSNKYDLMQSDLENGWWKVYLMPLEVGSRGQILKHTQTNIFTTLKHFHVKIKSQKKFIQSMSKISLLHLPRLPPIVLLPGEQEATRGNCQ